MLQDKSERYAEFSTTTQPLENILENVPYVDTRSRQSDIVNVLYRSSGDDARSDGAPVLPVDTREVVFVWVSLFRKTRRILLKHVVFIRMFVVRVGYSMATAKMSDEKTHSIEKSTTLWAWVGVN